VTAASSTAPGRRLFRELGLQILLLLGTLALAELLLRVIDLRELRDGYSVGAAMVYRYDAELGWRPRANASSVYRGAQTVSITTNSVGLRDIEHDNSPRQTVLFLGDSFTWGYDVEADQRFTEHLRDMFPKTRIVNAGVVGYGTDQEYLLLNEIWSTFEPDIVVLIFCVDNDRKDNATNASSPGYYKPYIEQSADDSWHFAGQPVPKSRHVYFIENPLVRNSWVARAAVTAYIYLRYPQIMVPDPTLHLIDMMRERVEARQKKFLIGLQRHDAALEAFLRQRGIPFTDFDGAAAFDRDGNHWTPQGQKLVAERLQALLVDAGGFASPPASQ
jgi:lysophospholipase L1-like esterase